MERDKGRINVECTPFTFLLKQITALGALNNPIPAFTRINHTEGRVLEKLNRFLFFDGRSTTSSVLAQRGLAVLFLMGRHVVVVPLATASPVGIVGYHPGVTRIRIVTGFADERLAAIKTKMQGPVAQTHLVRIVSTFRNGVGRCGNQNVTVTVATASAAKSRETNAGNERIASFRTIGKFLDLKIPLQRWRMQIGVPRRVASLELKHLLLQA
mmetsp:Transcript_12332/g.18942  ORF Transcript_12332/g.18942 Transcript_12332/m.18942 type:complete len:213 (-) Transcript_12332:643-1281(-)